MSLITPLSEVQIAELINMAKPMPLGISTKAMSERNGHSRKEYSFECSNGDCFVIKLRQSALNPLDFSAILGYKLPGVHTIFRLRRYNGRHHHTNILERTHLYDFHVHTATERYQRPGFQEDHYAEVTNRHFHLESALGCLLNDCGFNAPTATHNTGQGDLF